MQTLCLVLPWGIARIRIEERPCRKYGSTSEEAVLQGSQAWSPRPWSMQGQWQPYQMATSQWSYPLKLGAPGRWGFGRVALLDRHWSQTMLMRGQGCTYPSRSWWITVWVPSAAYNLRLEHLACRPFKELSLMKRLRRCQMIHWTLDDEPYCWYPVKQDPDKAPSVVYFQ